MEQGILSILVHNHFGVLTKVTGLFGRRGFNIKALSVGETENPELSRITILTEGNPAKLEQIYRQVCKLEVVKTAKIIHPEQLIERELMLIKISPQRGDTGSLMQLLTEYAAKATAAPDGYAIIEVSGTSEKIDDMIEKLRPFGISELSRTGVTALEVSSEALFHNEI